MKKDLNEMKENSLKEILLSEIEVVEENVSNDSDIMYGACPPSNRCTERV
jgi:hypothetical protein